MHAVHSKTLLGGLLWVVLISIVVSAYRTADPAGRSRAHDVLRQISRFSSEGPTWIQLHFDRPVELYHGDGIYQQHESELRRVGEIRHASEDRTTFRAVIDPSQHPELLTSAAAITSSASLPWVYETLLPAATMARIEAQWESFRSQNARRFLGVLAPILRDAFSDLSDLLKAELNASWVRHRTEIDELAERYGEELLLDRMLPLLIDEVWPIVVSHGVAPVERIGRDLWDDAPLFGLAWRGLYDRLPLTEGGTAEVRWERFVQDTVIPILRRHQPALEAAVTAILRDILSNDRVRADLRASLAQVREDEALQQLVQSIAADVIVSPVLRDYVQSQLREPRVVVAFDALRTEFDDFNRELVKNIVFAPDRKNISPDFSRFLRTMVLKKDWRWVLVHQGTTPFDPPEDAAVARVSLEVDR